MAKLLVRLIKLILNYSAKPLFYSKKITKKNTIISFSKFGPKNKSKFFYVIKRTPGAGLFSNVVFVLNHLMIAKRHNFIPIVDMESFPTIYNENRAIDGTKNAWEYYFESLNKYKLKDVYNSKNVFITDNKFYRFMTHEINNNYFKFVKKKIKIKKKHLNYANNYFKKRLKNKKVLGIHCRGTSYKTSANHPFPPTKKQIIDKTDKLMKKFKFDAIFLSTEEKNYFNIFKKKYDNKLYFINSYRSNYDDAFKHYPRNNHRYELGREILVETIILSKCNTFLHIDTNVSLFVNFFSTKKRPKFIVMKNGYNTSNEYLAKWLWYIKNIVPEILGGFKSSI